MRTIRLKVNQSLKVGAYLYVNTDDLPCQTKLTAPVLMHGSPATVYCPPGKTWVNPCGTNPKLTVVCSA